MIIVSPLHRAVQGDRRAGPSLSAFNYESVWGQRALREMYRAIMRDIRVPLATPQPCKPGEAATGFSGAAPAGCDARRRQLLRVGVYAAVWLVGLAASMLPIFCS